MSRHQKPVLAAVTDLQFGDSGKARVVDELVQEALQIEAEKSQALTRRRVVTVRFQGGENAGHTMYIRNGNGLQKEVVHLVPSGIVSGVDIAIGPHVAFNPLKFMEELTSARERWGYDGRVMISERTGILFDYHKKLDAWREEQRSEKIGTTKSGIGPFYEDCARRDTRITFQDYLSEGFPKRLQDVVSAKRSELTEAGILYPSFVSDLFVQHETVRRELRQYQVNLEEELFQVYFARGHHIIIEGAQGTGLDVDLGTLPDVTSSHLLAPYAFPSLGLSRGAFKIFGVEKIYPTRVGSGDLPTLAPEFESIAALAGEVGATTGRVRRAGYPDWVFVKRAARLNDCDGIYLTRADCVQDVELKVCNAYEVEGKQTNTAPLNLGTVKPLYSGETFQWQLWDGTRDFSEPENVDEQLKAIRAEYTAKGFSSFPQGLQDFVREHDAYVGVPTVGITIGPARGESVSKGLPLNFF